MHPSACPNSCTTTALPGIQVSSRCHPRSFIHNGHRRLMLEENNSPPEQSFPIADHEPGSATKEMRTCAIAGLNEFQLDVRVIHPLPRPSSVRSFSAWLEPSRNRQVSVWPFSHFLRFTTAIFTCESQCSRRGSPRGLEAMISRAAATAVAWATLRAGLYESGITRSMHVWWFHVADSPDFDALDAMIESLSNVSDTAKESAKATRGSFA